MKQMKVYNIYLEQPNDEILKVVVPHFSEKEAIEWVTGNGECITSKLCDLQNIDIACLTDTLLNARWGRKEIDIITRCLEVCGLMR